MHRVNDDRHPRAPCGDTSKDAGCRIVGVYDIVVILFDKGGELIQHSNIRYRLRIAMQIREQKEGIGALPALLDPVDIILACREMHLVMSAGKLFDCQQRVIRCSAKPEVCDQLENFYFSHGFTLMWHMRKRIWHSMSMPATDDRCHNRRIGIDLP